MVFLSDWYPKNSSNGIGFFSNRWRNSRRFSNMVPMLYQDMEMHDVLFGVISVKFQIQLVMVPILEQPNEKLLGVNYKKHQNIIESDATIVALIFAYLLDL
jgi:deoxyhypusine synthase